MLEVGPDDDGANNIGQEGRSQRFQRGTCGDNLIYLIPPSCLYEKKVQPLRQFSALMKTNRADR